jgi:hypothetical protein
MQNPAIRPSPEYARTARQHRRPAERNAHGARMGDGEETGMNKWLALVVGVGLSAVSLSAQGKPVLVVQPFTAAPGVELPYDMKQMQAQLVPELRVMLGKELEVVAEAPATTQGTVYTLNGEITGWRAGNTAKRLLVGMGAGRESSDLKYQVTDVSGKNVVDQTDTIRTNFYSQTGSTGTLAHPIAQKVADRIKKAKLR